MNWFKNMKIRMKLLTSFLLVAILAGTIGYMGITRLKTLETADTKMYEKITVPLNDLAEAAIAFQRTRVNVRDAILANNEMERNAKLARIQELSLTFHESAKKIESTLITAEGKAEFEKLMKAYESYIASVSDIKNLLETGNRDGAALVMTGQMKVDNDVCQKSIDYLLTRKVEIAKETSDENIATSKSATNFMLILILVVLAASIALGFIIATNIQNIIKSVIAQTKTLVDAAVGGKLATRANAEETNQEFREIVIGINNTLDAVIGPLNVAAEYVDRISKGNIPAKITDNYNGDFNEIKNNLNSCIDAVNLLVADATMLSKAAVEGKLATRADASKHDGDFGKIVQGVNDTLDAVIGPLNVAAEYVDRISKGNIPAKITDNYNGDFNEIKNNLNSCIDAVNLLVADANMLSIAAVEGKLATRADASKHDGDFGKIVQGVNNTLDAVIGPLNVAAEYVDRISKGNIPEKITDNYNGDFNEIKTNLNACIVAVNMLVADANMLATAAVEGKLATRADASKHDGDFRKIVAGVNNTLDAVIGPLNVAAEYVDRISKGNIPDKITDNYNGDFNEIKNNLNVCIDSVNMLVADANMLAKAAVNGQLATRADASRHQGDFRKIVEGVNDTLDAVIGPLNVAAEYVDRIAKGDMPTKITDNYNGDFNSIKNNLNQLIDALVLVTDSAKKLAHGDLDVKIVQRSENDELLKALSEMVAKLTSIVSEVYSAAQNVADGSLAISSSAQQMAQGANEQASSVEEVSSSIEEMTSSIEQNTDNAQQTEKTALKAATDITEGNKAVGITIDAMKDIAEKITVITAIAEKTDLLAINAAIEAARAGEHGEGFAVVAAEVRKLAELSQDAAKEITKVARNSVQVAEKSGELLKNIVPDIQNTAKLVQEIAAASIEQKSGTKQINGAVNQLNTIAQQNASSAEELSSSSEELTSQADQLKEVISFFKIAKNSNQFSSFRPTKHEKKVNVVLNENLKSHSAGTKIKLSEASSQNDELFEHY